jgi:GntR family transcriptional regulator / MocR family aminotransferase
MANPSAPDWSNLGLDLHLELERRAGRGIRATLEASLRDAIRSGRLRRGRRLPATRTLARDLGVSRGTVQEAYAQLAAEGWIAGRQGSGTVVAIDAPPDHGQPARPAPPRRWRHDLRPGRPDASSFPRQAWLRALKRAMQSAPGDVLSYAEPAGQLALRIELAAYLARARGLRVTPADLLVTTGYTQGLGLVARVLAEDGCVRVAFENPSMALHREVVAAAGHALVPITVDDDGLRVDALDAAGDVRAVVLTPNRQHPTGATLHPARRSRLLEWARARAALIVEDDYDGEFRYDRQPLGPLQALDPDLVAYAGTTSKTLAPGLRLGWLALPASYRARTLRQKTLADSHTGALEQLGLTEMLRTHAYDRHVRAMRLRYQRRRDALLEAFKQRLPGLEVRGAAAGLNVLVPLADVAAERTALSAARIHGVAIEGLATRGYFTGDGPAGLIVGYAAAPEHGYAAALEALVVALESALA